MKSGKQCSLNIYYFQKLPIFKILDRSFKQYLQKVSYPRLFIPGIISTSDNSYFRRFRPRNTKLLYPQDISRQFMR